MSPVRFALASTGLALSLAACDPAPPGPSVDQSTDAAPRQVDASLVSPFSLENTHWRLAQIAGHPPQIAPGDRTEPYFVLMSDGRRLQGFTGCNRMAGTYETDGRSLRLGSIVSTKMACADPRNPEEGFLKALDATTSARVSGNRLELLDGDGTALAMFEARAHPAS